MRAWLEYAWREGLRTRLLEDACLCESLVTGHACTCVLVPVSSKARGLCNRYIGPGEGAKGAVAGA